MNKKLKTVKPYYLPALELLAGVLSQTCWLEAHGPEGSGNKYFRALKSFCDKYKDHKAIEIAQQLTSAGFVYDAPPAFICHLGQLPELPLEHEYSDYLLKRANGKENLENFRMALSDLAYSSNFLEFFREWEPYLNDSLKVVNDHYRAEKLISWLEEFFGWPANDFRVVMSPSMFSVYYGASVENEKGKFIAYQIIGENGTSTGQPQFPTGLGLEHLTIHEFGHFFVNPSMEAFPERAKRLEPLLAPVVNIMEKQAYNSISIFLNELVLRSVEILAARDLFEKGVDQKLLQYHKEDGFYLIDGGIAQLDSYRKERDKYPTFKDFVPVIYKWLENV